jgi:hypothetical protein
MVDGLLAVINHQILLADIGNVIAVRILGEQMVKWLILRRPDIFGNRFVPFLAVRKDGVDVENYAAKFEMAVTHNVANVEARMRDGRKLFGGGTRDVRVHNSQFSGFAARHKRMTLGKPLCLRYRPASDRAGAPLLALVPLRRGG